MIRITTCFILCFSSLPICQVGLSADTTGLIRRATTAWSEYQNMQVYGTATRIQDGKTVEHHRFVVNVGQSTGKSCPPMEVGFLAPNPGEPHLPEGDIFDTAIAYNGKYFGIFNRRYVSHIPHEVRVSTVLLSEHIPGGGEWPAYLIFESILGDITCADPRESHGLAEAISARASLQILGTQDFLGHEATRVRLEIPWDPAVKIQEHSPLQFESLVVTSPTFQGVQVLGVTGGKGDWAEQNSHKYQSRRVESLKIMGKWLLCDRVRYGDDSHYWLVELQSANDLPSGHLGMWEFDSITGANFSGTLEKATRRGSVRQTYDHTPHVTFIPYTAEEQSKIRKYLISKSVPVEPQTNWYTVAFLVANAIAVCILAWYAYRRYSLRRFAVWLLCLSGLAASAHAADSSPNAADRDPIQIPSVPLAVSTYDGYCGIAAAEYVASRFCR